MGILDTLPQIGDIDEYFKALFYGHQGSGKTQLAAGAPKPVWIDFENSTETLRNIGRTEIPVLRPKNMAKVEEIVKEAVKDSSPFETIVLDTLNSMQVFQMLEHMMVSTNNGSKRDMDLPYQADFRKSTAMIQRIMHMLHHCNKHVIILCQERIYTERQDDGREKVVAIRPDVTKRLADIVEQMLNVVGYLEKKSGATPSSPVKRTMYLNPSGKIFAKNRLGIEAITIEDPTYTKIFTNKGKS